MANKLVTLGGVTLAELLPVTRRLAGQQMREDLAPEYAQIVSKLDACLRLLDQRDRLALAAESAVDSQAELPSAGATGVGRPGLGSGQVVRG